MSKELEALEIIKKHLPTLYPEECGFDNIDGCFEPSKECQYQLDIIETALKHLEVLEQELCFVKTMEDLTIEAMKDKKLKALEIIKESVRLKMSVDEDIGCLYVPITKCFQPLEQNIVIVGYVKGKDKIDLLKEVLL